MALPTKLITVGKIAERMGIGHIVGAKKAYHWLNELAWRTKKAGYLEVQGSQMYLDPHHPQLCIRNAHRSYYSNRMIEPLTTAKFSGAIREGDVVVDIGANIGYYSLLAGKRVGVNGRVYAVEPVTANYQMLVVNIIKNKYDYILPLKKGISNEIGKSKIYLSWEDCGCHTMRKHHDLFIFNTVEAGENEDIETTTLDAEFGDKHIDLIKMDIEGYECRAWSVASRMLLNNPKLKIIMEFNPKAAREVGDSPEGLLEYLMVNQKFQVTVIDELGSKPSNECIEVRDLSHVMDLVGDKAVNLYMERLD